MQYHAILLDTTSTTFTFCKIENQTETKKKTNTNKTKEKKKKKHTVVPPPKGMWETLENNELEKTKNNKKHNYL